MNVIFDDRGEWIDYRIYDFDAKYEPILQSCFYQKVKNGYTKTYPKHAKYLNQMMMRYARYAQNMFDQLGYFAEIPWERGLVTFCERIQQSDIDWWLTGSCAACIRGIDLHPHDIDIMIDSKDVDQMTELFKDSFIEPVIDTNGWLTKDFGVMFLDVRIDIASDPNPILDTPDPVDCGPYAKEHLERVSWNDFEINVPPLELQITVNTKRGRFDRVKKMQDYLNHEHRAIIL